MFRSESIVDHRDVAAGQRSEARSQSPIHARRTDEVAAAVAVEDHAARSAVHAGPLGRDAVELIFVARVSGGGSFVRSPQAFHPLAGRGDGLRREFELGEPALACDRMTG